MSRHYGVARAEAPPFEAHIPAMECRIDKGRAAKNSADFFGPMRRG